MPGPITSKYSNLGNSCFLSENRNIMEKYILGRTRKTLKNLRIILTNFGNYGNLVQGQFSCFGPAFMFQYLKSLEVQCTGIHTSIVNIPRKVDYSNIL